MRLISFALGLSALVCVSPLPTHADSTQNAVVTSTDTATSLATARVLAELGTMFDARNRLRAFHVRYSHRMALTDAAITVAGDIQKPNKINLRILDGKTLLGEFVSDGVTETYYDPSTNIYMRRPAPQSFDVAGYSPTIYDLMANLKYRFDWPLDGAINEHCHTSAKQALGGAIFMLQTATPGDADEKFLDSVHAKLLKIQSGPAVRAELIDLTFGGQDGVQIDFAYNAKSGLPITCRTGVVDPGGRGDRFAFNDFEDMKIKPIAGHFPFTTFTWRPPAGAKPYQSGEWNKPGFNDINQERLLFGPK